jgi:hypothetical protein
MSYRFALSAVLAAMFPLVPAAAQAAADEVHVLVLAAVSVGPEGEVTAVELVRPPLPDPVRDVLQQAVRGFRFAPVRIDGAPASVTTGMLLSTCLVGAGAELAVAVQPTRIGPQPLEQQARMPVPRELFPSIRKGMSLAIDFTVQADGSARVDAMTLPRLSGRERRAVEKLYADMIGGMRFIPDHVNGQPVATRMTWPVTISPAASGRPDSRGADATCARARTEVPQAPRRVEGSDRLRLRDPD